MTNPADLIASIVGDLQMVAAWVATQPRGYAGFQAERAKFLLHTVDPELLSELLHDVRFTTQDYRSAFYPLTPTEIQVEEAAIRLTRLQRSIQTQKNEIQARMAA